MENGTRNREATVVHAEDRSDGQAGRVFGRHLDAVIEPSALPPGKLLSEVEPERVEWLWPGRLPLGKLTVLDGDPGLGKSVITLDLAARVSAGLQLPNGKHFGPAGVVLLSAEDALADTIRPRLDAAGADPERIVALSTVAEGSNSERMICIPKDLHILERAIGRVEAALVVVDPLMAFLGGKMDSHKDQDVRRALAPLAAMAERTSATVLIVRHLNKSAGGNTLYRGGGSIAIIGAARSGLVIAQDPEDPERRILAANKHNLSRPAPSLAFRIGEAPNGAARVEWGGTSLLTARDILKEPVDPEQKSALSEAKGFLSQELAYGAVAAEEVKEDAHGAGVSERTLKRAKRDLGVVSRKRGGVWYWELAQEEPEEGHSSAVGTVGPLGKDANPTPADSAYLREGGQGCQEGQVDHVPRCIHDYPAGVGCYLCDPQHPYRLEQGGTA